MSFVSVAQATRALLRFWVWLVYMCVRETGGEVGACKSLLVGALV